MFRRYWEGLSRIGVKVDYSDKLIRRITLTNQFSCIGCIVFILSGIQNYLLGDTFSAVVIECLAIICMTGFFLNHKGFHRIATSYLLVCISAAIFYFDSYAGIPAGVYLFYFPLILAIAFLFDFNDKLLLLLHFLLPIVLLLINLITGYGLFANPALSSEDRYSMFALNLSFSAATIGFFMYLTIANNIRENLVFEQRINERKATEKAIKQALSEKDILLAEIHHRVKNNLAIIASLLNLQISGVENEEAKAILLDSKNRVKSMALIHDRLYKSSNLTEIDFTHYIHELITEIRYSYPTLSGNIKVITNVGDIRLNVNSAIPCGLILNELLSNCYKHAFKGRENGTIRIRLLKQADRIKLCVEDNGLRLKKDFRDTGSLGMVVIESLSEQLDGRHSFITDNGTRFEMEFEQHLPQQD